MTSSLNGISIGVICFSPRHDLTLPEMEPAGVREVVDVWAEQVLDLYRAE